MRVWKCSYFRSSNIPRIPRDARIRGMLDEVVFGHDASCAFADGSCIAVREWEGVARASGRNGLFHHWLEPKCSKTVLSFG